MTGRVKKSWVYLDQFTKAPKLCYMQSKPITNNQCNLILDVAQFWLRTEDFLGSCANGNVGANRYPGSRHYICLLSRVTTVKVYGPRLQPFYNLIQWEARGSIFHGMTSYNNIPLLPSRLPPPQLQRSGWLQQGSTWLQGSDDICTCFWEGMWCDDNCNCGSCGTGQ